MRCRICRTAKNLKYTPQQLRLQSKNRNKNKLRLPLSAIPQTTGNICIDCDERLQNFHHLDDDSDVVDVDSDGFHENRKRHVEIPIIVDDDERLFNMFYNKSPPQCNEAQPLQCQSLGSDGDAEVIEVLTSRETTPDVTAGFTSNEISKSVAMPATPIIIDIIDLENYDETGKKCSEQTTNCNKSTCTGERETRLLGCLNLVTSDSESEINFEPCPPEEKTQLPIKAEPTPKIIEGLIDGSVECTNNNNIHFKNSILTIQHNKPVCGTCGISFSDKPSLQAHMREHEDFKCPACNAHFHMPLDLVNHMRKKHRSYDGNDLCEGARCSQDSAMTIRLRFRQRFIFYECQLCGLIESQFKAHKTHIMQKHADESKSLRDPMMKTQLKCPACHQNCGTQQIEICRHLLTKHDPTESSIYLKEIIDIQTIVATNKYLRNMQDGVRFLTLDSHKSYFIECLLCRKTFASHHSFSAHLNGHNIDEWKAFRAQKLTATSTSGTVEIKRSLKRKIETRNASRTDSEQAAILPKMEDQPLTKKPKLEYEMLNNVKNSVKPKKIPLPKETKSKTETINKKLPANNIKPEFLTPSDIKRQRKLKHKVEKMSQNKRGQPKLPSKVKVKPPLRHFPTQKYNCKHCQLPFKGFRKLQMHLLSTHRSEEYHNCGSCTRAFTTNSSLKIHRSQNICRRKRKCTSITQSSNDSKDNDNLDENSNKNERKFENSSVNTNNHQIPISSTISEPQWLKELLQLSRENQLKNIANSSTANGNIENFDATFFRPEHEQLNTEVLTLCRFCGQLYVNADEFLVHENNHIALKELPWINFSQINCESNSI